MHAIGKEPNLQNLFKLEQPLPEQASPNAVAHRGLGHSLQSLLPGPSQRGQGGGLGNLDGLLDSLNLSPGVQGSMQYAKAQFEVNYQSIRAVSNEQGTYFEQVNFSLSASFEFLQSASGEAPIEMDELDGESMLEELQKMFSPEKTADRILNFALSQYAPEGEDNSSARQEFADRIGGAIQRGFDEAQEILGKLEESIQEGIDDTHRRVFDGLDHFVENGLPEGHDDRSHAIREYVSQWQASVQLSYSRVEVTSYNARGLVSGRSVPPGASAQLEASA